MILKPAYCTLQPVSGELHPVSVTQGMVTSFLEKWPLSEGEALVGLSCLNGSGINSFASCYLGSLLVLLQTRVGPGSQAFHLR